MNIDIVSSRYFVYLIPTIQLFFMPIKGNRSVMISFLFWTISITF